MTRPAAEGSLFALLVAVSLIPLWLVAYLPTADGPSHLYNAWLVRELAAGDAHPRLAATYELAREPLPNWLQHAGLALLLGVVSPGVAEKLVLSACLALFLLSLRALAGAVDPGARWYAFLGFPLAYNWLFQMGFTNFCLSLGLALLALAVWWRRRERPDLRTAVALNALLLLCYFAHILSTVLALAAIGVLWLATLRRATWRRHLRHLAILAPQTVLPVWFVAARGTAPMPEAWSAGTLVRYLTRLEVLVTFEPAQIRLGIAVAAAFGLLVVLTLASEGVGRRPADAFLLLAVLALALYFVVPPGLAGGSLVKQRLSLLPYLFLVPWLSPRLGRPFRAAGIAALALLALWSTGQQLRWYRTLDREMQVFLRGLEGIPVHSTLVPLLFDRFGTAARVPIFNHAADYVALERELVDWDNYEAGSALFPVRFRPGLLRPDIWTLEAQPYNYRPGVYRESVDYVYTWKLPPGTPVARRLRHHYDLVSAEGDGRLYRRKPSPPPRAGALGGRRQPPRRPLEQAAGGRVLG